MKSRRANKPLKFSLQVLCKRKENSLRLLLASGEYSQVHYRARSEKHLQNLKMSLLVHSRDPRVEMPIVEYMLPREQAMYTMIKHNFIPHMDVSGGLAGAAKPSPRNTRSITPTLRQFTARGIIHTIRWAVEFV